MARQPNGEWFRLRSALTPRHRSGNPRGNVQDSTNVEPVSCNPAAPRRYLMPAVTVDDLTVLPHLKEPGLADRSRAVWQVTTAPSGYEGEGFPVRRAFA